MYVVFICLDCGQILLAKAIQKTKRCPNCSTRLKLVEAKKIAYLKTAQEASNYLRALKRKRAAGYVK
jgi:DNA-directed RNA polymerase subunit RPC12/RpoP